MQSKSWFQRFFGSKSTKKSGPRAAPNIPAGTFNQTRDTASFPRFKGLSREERLRSPRGAATRTLLSRAFTPAQPVSDLGRFAGRTKLLNRMISAVEDQGMHLVVFGDRGIGKTSLLHVLAILAKDARYLVRYASCSESSTFDSLFRAVARDVPLLYHAGYDPSSLEVERDRSLGDILGEDPVTPASLSEELVKLTGTKLLIILDEFDRSPEQGFRDKVAELIKSLSDRSARVQLVIGGVALNLSELVAHVPSIRRNVLGIAVAGMAPDELGQIIAKGETIGNFSFENATRDLLIEMSNGSPYLANLLGQYSARTALENDRRVISSQDLRVAVELVLDDMHSRLSPTAQAQLNCLEAKIKPTSLFAAGRFAQKNFGLLPEDMVKEIIATLGADSLQWQGTDGQFLFCDDSIPQILALKYWPDTGMAPSDVTTAAQD